MTFASHINNGFLARKSLTSWNMKSLVADMCIVQATIAISKWRLAIARVLEEFSDDCNVRGASSLIVHDAPSPEHGST